MQKIITLATNAAANGALTEQLFDGDFEVADVWFSGTFGGATVEIQGEPLVYTDNAPTVGFIDLSGAEAINLNSTAKDGKLTLQIARFKAPVGYPKNGTIAERLPYSLQSENALFLAQSTIIGHQDGSMSKTKYGGVVDNASSAKFKSFHGILQSYSGVRCMWAWTSTVLTDEEIAKIDINLYKLFN